MTAAAIAGLGHNSMAFGEDEIPSLTTAQKLKFAHEALLCANLLKTVANVTKKEILGKRQGVRGYILRCILEEYMIFRGCPKKYLAKLIGVQRDVPGDDERRAWSVRDHPRMDNAVYGIHQFLGSGIIVAADMIGLLKDWANAEPEPEEPEPPPPPPPPPPAKPQAPYRPGVDPKPESIKRQREAAQIVAKANYERRDAYLTSRIEASKKVILKGGRDGASKDDRDNAKSAARELEAAMADRKKLRAAWKRANPATSKR